MQVLFALLLSLVFLSTPAFATPPSPLVQGNNDFAVDMYSQLKTEPGNIIFSPLSLSTALAMTYAGAREQTATEMANTMHFGLDQQQLPMAMGGLLKDLNAGGDAHGYKLKVVNALWLEKSFEFQPEFLKLTHDNYDAGLNVVDFRTASDDARLTINQWVEEQTAQKIKELIPPHILNSLTRLVLTNAVYFKGDWRSPFEKVATQDGPFHIAADTTVTTPLMHKTAAYYYLDGGSFQALQIPYKGDDLSMILFLPKTIDGLEALENSMTTANIQNWINGLAPAQHVQITLPKFKATLLLDNLVDTFTAMGMRQAFLYPVADFSGIADPHKNNNESLFISQIIHKAYVAVDENGTEAAAATAVIMMAESAMARPEEPIVFNADHPFIFLIRDDHSGSILFWGRLADPSNKN